MASFISQKTFQTYSYAHFSLFSHLAKGCAQEISNDEDADSKSTSSKLDVGDQTIESKCQSKEATTADSAKLTCSNSFTTRMSALNFKQHKDYLMLRDKFQNSNANFSSAASDDSRTYFKKLQTMVQQEQRVFMKTLENFIARRPPVYKLHDNINQYMHEMLHCHWKRLLEYPRYYTIRDLIPLISTTYNIKGHAVFQHLCTVLELGIIPNVDMPAHSKKVTLPRCYLKLNQRYPANDENQKKGDSDVLFKTPVSRDPNAKSLATKYGANVVMSSGSLRTLFANNEQCLENSWEIPLVVAEHDRGDGVRVKVLYVDKPFKPEQQSVFERNLLYHKRSLKGLLLQPKHPKAIRLSGCQNPTKVAVPIDTLVPAATKLSSTDTAIKDDQDAIAMECTVNVVPPAVESSVNGSKDIFDNPSNHSNDLKNKVVASSNIPVNAATDTRIVVDENDPDASVKEGTLNVVPSASDATEQCSSSNEICDNYSNHSINSEDGRLFIDSSFECSQKNKSTDVGSEGGTIANDIATSQDQDSPKGHGEPNRELEVGEKPEMLHDEQNLQDCKLTLVEQPLETMEVDAASADGHTPNSAEMLQDLPQSKKVNVDVDITEKVPDVPAKSTLEAIVELQAKTFGSVKLSNLAEASENTAFNMPENSGSYIPPLHDRNLCYHLWRIGRLNVLVRCAIDGSTLVCKKKQKKQKFWHLVPKMEYMAEYNMAAALAYSEYAHQWVSTAVTPNVNLARVRINAYNSEVIGIEALELDKIAPSRSGFRPQDCIHILATILEKAYLLPPGNYVLSHTTGEGTCKILKEISESERANCKALYDLHQPYLKSCLPQPTTTVAEPVAFPTLDPDFAFFNSKRNARIPATFKPKRTGIGNTNTRKKKKRKGRNVSAKK